jgi:hypothetical protein
VHSNMVLVYDRSQESSFIDLLEVEGGWSTLAPALFVLIAFQKFLLADLELGGKKNSRRKKS